jgi:hypothetical protein
MKPELRVFVRRTCVINPPPPAPAPEAAAEALPFVGMAIPKVVEFALGGIGSLLKKAGQEETDQASGSEIVNLFVADKDQRLSANADVGCILAVYGTFADEDRKPTPASDTALKKLETEQLVPRDADVSMILELAVARTSDQTAFYVEARHFSVRDFIGSRNKSDRTYVATVSLAVPDASADGSTIALGHVALGRMSKETLSIAAGALGGHPRYRSNLMPWNQISGDAKKVYESDVKRNVAAGKGYMPVTLGVTLTETADGNRFLATLGTLLQGAKEEAGKQVAKLVDPAAREKAAQESADAAEELWAAEEDAIIAVRKAEVELATGDAEDKPVLEAKLAKAKRALAVAVRLRKAAGLGDLPSV